MFISINKGCICLFWWIFWLKVGWNSFAWNHFIQKLCKWNPKWYVFILKLLLGTWIKLNTLNLIKSQMVWYTRAKFVLEVYRYQVSILVSRECCALKFSIYIPQTIGKNFIPNLMFCDVSHFKGNLTPLWDIDCDSAARSWSRTNFLIKDKYLHSITVTAIGAIGWTGILLRKYSDQSLLLDDCNAEN